MANVAIIVFPGTNRERDMAHAVTQAGGKPTYVWHSETSLPTGTDVVCLAGGFSYGDYLRTGAIAARSAIMQAVIQGAEKGIRVLGVCNGFQILCETGLLPGVLMRNASRRFICKQVGLRVEQSVEGFTTSYEKGTVLHVPIAHGEGNYVADTQTLARLEGNGQVVFRYVENPNGSTQDIAGIVNEKKNVLGMMPHPENHVDALQGNQDGLPLFRALMGLI